MKWTIVLFLIVGLGVWIGRHNAREFQAWQEARQLAVDNLQATQGAYMKARLDYAECLGWARQVDATAANCHASEMDLDDAHKEKEKARQQFQQLPKMPDLYFGGYFLRH